MTPCEEKGYEVGQVFQDNRDGHLHILTRDEGYSNVESFDLTERTDRECLAIQCIKRIYPPEEVRKEVTMTCDETGKKTKLSRESAEELNLC